MNMTFSSYCFFCFLILSIFKLFHGEIFSSVYKLQMLAQEEGRLLGAFNEYKTNLQLQSNQMSRVLCKLYEDIEPIVNKSCSDGAYAENPINVLHLLDRYLNTWPKVVSSVLCDCCVITDRERDFNRTYNKVKKEVSEWPSEYDLLAATRALLRLRTTYNLDIDLLIRGTIYDEHTYPMMWSLMELIIEEAEESEMFDEALLWCDAVLSLPLSFHRSNATKIEMSVKQIKARIYNKAGFSRNAAELLREYSHTGTLSVREDFQYYESHSDKKRGFVEEWPLRSHVWEINNVKKQLCRNEIRKPVEEISRLVCYMSNTIIPYYKAKAEEMNLDPRIIVFHDVISDSEIDFLKQQGSISFTRSGLQNKGTEIQSNDDIRVSFTGWVDDDDNHIACKISRRVELITGLDTTHREALSSSEAFQVVNYGIGGFFKPHYDNLFCPIWGPPLEQDISVIKGSGDRIATWMFYMSDVKAGGATIFPRTNTRIPVIKRAAAFWYNILPNGEMDRRVLHGGCPVVLGSKWISNKWIRETGQMYRRPCGLNYNATV